MGINALIVAPLCAPRFKPEQNIITAEAADDGGSEGLGRLTLSRLPVFGFVLAPAAFQSPTLLSARQP